MMKFIGIFLFALSLMSSDGAASNTLSDCNMFIAKFSQTCNPTGVAATSVANMAGVNVTCASGFTSDQCPGTYLNGGCVFTRKLCLSCSGTSTIRIRIQTNGLPRFCFSTSANAIKSKNIDFEVNYNPNVDINSLQHNPQTQTALDAIVCNVQNQKDAPTGSNLVNMGDQFYTLAGVSIDGVAILNVNSANNVDPFFPSGGIRAETVDACLAHAEPTGTYHYHIGSGCALNPPTSSISACGSTSGCSSNVATYSISTFSNYRSMNVIGIAKDGHHIYGPYDSTGTEITKGFDICNGMFYDSMGSYAYFVTRTYPYITGCFGPGNYPSVVPSCTTNPPSLYSKSSNVTVTATAKPSSASNITILFNHIPSFLSYTIVILSIIFTHSRQ